MTWMRWLLNWLSSNVYFVSKSFLHIYLFYFFYCGCVDFRPPPSQLADFSWLFWNVVHVGPSARLSWDAFFIEYLIACDYTDVVSTRFELLSQAHKGHELLRWQEFCHLSQCSLSLYLFFSLCWPLLLISTAALVYSIENDVYPGCCVHCSVMLITTVF